jgi:hypothetical protein
MKKFIFALLFIGLSLALFAGDEQIDSTKIHFNKLYPEPEHRKVSQLIAHILTQQHYQNK